MAAARSLIDAYAVYIDGQWVAPDNGHYDDICPATEAVIAAAPDPSRAQVGNAIAAARTAFDSGPWANAGPEQRAGWLNQLGDGLLQHADEFFALGQVEWGCTANERTIHIDGIRISVRYWATGSPRPPATAISAPATSAYS